MNIEIQEQAVEIATTVETFVPRFQVLDDAELDQVGGGNCVADY